MSAAKFLLQTSVEMEHLMTQLPKKNRQEEGELFPATLLIPVSRDCSVFKVPHYCKLSSVVAFFHAVFDICTTCSVQLAVGDNTYSLS